MDGVIIIDKPAGWTSHDVVARVRRILQERRIGHTGTLDPFATGVLVVLVGRATRLAQFLSSVEKEYEAVVRLGYATETGDLTGARRGEFAMCGGWSAGEIEAALKSLRGEIEQVPPMYSAKKVQGRKLYELARRGVEVERAAVRVTVHEIEAIENEAVENGVGKNEAIKNDDGLLRRDEGASRRNEDALRRDEDRLLRHNEDGTCDLSIRVVCSAGTYVRVLAESIGASLGVGAHLAELRRTRAGAFGVGASVSLDRLSELAEGDAVGEVLTGMSATLPEMPATHLTFDEARRVQHGAAVRAARVVSESWADGAHVRMCDAEGRLLAVGVYDFARGIVQPRVMLAGDDGEEK